MREDFTPNFGDKRSGCCVRTAHHLTLPFISRLNRNSVTVIPTHPSHLTWPPCDFSLFLQLKIKVRGRHYDRIEVIEAELQAVPNTLTEHYFQDAFKKWQKRWEQCIHAERDYLKGDGGQ
jgi:hypothetical protein